MARFCGSQPTINDCLNCPYDDCINDSVKEPHKQDPVQLQKWQKDYRDKFRAAGVCPYCRKKPLTDGYKMCAACRAYFREKRKESSYRYGVLPRSLLDGMERCTKCGRKLNAATGYKLCDKCLGQARAALDKTPTHNGVKMGSYFERWHETFWAKTSSQKSE